ncbi:MAG: hypothetical protein RIT27_1239 [Pseudomonadota bacterium]
MFDGFIAIRGQDFLMFFWIFFGAAVVVGRWLMGRADESKHFSMPSPSQLNTYEIAALRDGRKGVIHTALFNLWQADLIKVSGKNQDAHISLVSPQHLAPKNNFEAILFHYIKEQPRKPADFFSASSIHDELNNALENSYQKLEKLHLRRTEEQLANVKRIGNVFFWSIMILGLTKLYFGITYGRPVLFLVISLVIAFIVGLIVFSPSNPFLSTLGKRYLKSLQKHFSKTQNAMKMDIDPALRVAIFGVAALAGFAIFAEFQEAFAASAMSSNSSSGGCGGGCGGSDGGGSDGGGGCGGCGGGGGD